MTDAATRGEDRRGRWRRAGAGLLLLAAGLLIGCLALGCGDGGGGAQSPGGAKILHWTCSMHPQIIRSGPGQCPICNMNLVPVYAGAGGETAPPPTGRPAGTATAAPILKLSRDEVELAKIETTPVARQFVTHEVRLYGKVADDESRRAVIAARVSGRIDRLDVNYVGAVVAAGQALGALYSPELLTAQAELLAARAAAEAAPTSRDAPATLAAAREKLRLWGFAPEQLVEIERRGTAGDHLELLAPLAGTVVEKNALVGMYVEPGTSLFTVADRSRVWVRLEAYESDLPWLRVGQEVEFTVEALPGESFRAPISFIDSVVQGMARTVGVRLELANPDGRLRPEELVHATARATLDAAGRVLAPDAVGDARPPLVIPVSAPLLTGKRAVVYVADAARPGVYAGREVTLGPRAGDCYLVLGDALREGELVVTRGNFAIDSSLQIQGRRSMMRPAASAAPVAAPAPTGHRH